jgi:hypothetical protein
MGENTLAPDQISYIRGRLYNRKKKAGARTVIRDGKLAGRHVSTPVTCTGAAYSKPGDTARMDLDVAPPKRVLARLERTPRGHPQAIW